MKKFISLILVLTLMCSLFVGCASKDEEANTGSGESSVVEIDFWNFPNYTVIDEQPGKYEEQLVAAFEAKNPGIKVNVQMIDFKSGPEKINTAIAAGTAPDVLYDAPGRIISWGKDGALARLNDMIDEGVKSNVSESILRASRDGDNYYMYPTHHAPFMMAFNKTKLEELGLMDMVNLEGNRAWTVDEFEALLKALNDAGERGPIVFASSQGGDQGTRAFIANLYDSPITNDDLTAYTVNSDNGAKSLQWMKDMIEAGYLENGSAYDAGTAIDEFVAGRVAGTLLWSPGLQKIYAEKYDFETVFLPYPNSADPKLEFLVGGLCVLNNGDDAKIEASKKFVDFIANDPEWGAKNIESTGSFPVDKRIKVNYEGAHMDYNSSMSDFYSTYYNTIPGFVEMRTYWFPTLQAVINGDKEAQEALDDFVEKSNATIK
ncbi:carbohydrate ABC transporter substrate-binding protein [Acidaminobacter sp. JC074]|uniref:ABC transporter substrate-binding protein n=1 Tax=Acidaminobacter sp. JC074 TaxID=2530199 RepID=UPI001F0DB5CF|nr:ABC transporter substrate-binding protein [Acidaminobacter sp. JC074]MCH4887503.1 carbohydrate ABC transporter substrate-binding protein [Acidaminobacter sp. JC074]